jgi:polyhydroxyalkanoate synthesis regulator phasin
MTQDDVNNQLAALVNSGDTAFANAAQFVQQVLQQVQSGNMPPDQAEEVLQDVQKQMEIIQDMNQLALKETMNTVINGAISLISAVS